MLSIYQTAADFYQQTLLVNRTIQQYLVKRGVQPGSIKKWQLGYAELGTSSNFVNHMLKTYPVSDLEQAGLCILQGDELIPVFQERLVVPVHDQQGQIVALYGRTMQAQNKHKWLSIGKRGDQLFGLATCVRSSKIVVVEGLIDVIVAQQQGEHNVVSAFGTNLTLGQYQLLKARGTKTVVLLLDGDAGGEQAVLTEIERYVRFYRKGLALDLKIATLPPGFDPDTLILNQPVLWDNAVAEAQLFIFPFLAYLTRQYPGMAVEARTRSQQLKRAVMMLSAFLQHPEYKTYFNLVKNQLPFTELELQQALTLQLQRYHHLGLLPLIN